MSQTALEENIDLIQDDRKCKIPNILNSSRKDQNISDIIQTNIANIEVSNDIKTTKRNIDDTNDFFKNTTNQTPFEENVNLIKCEPKCLPSNKSDIDQQKFNALNTIRNDIIEIGPFKDNIVNDKVYYENFITASISNKLKEFQIVNNTEYYVFTSIIESKNFIINHNLESEYINVDLQVLQLDGSYKYDILSITLIDCNTISIDSLENVNIKLIITKIQN